MTLRCICWLSGSKASDVGPTLTAGSAASQFYAGAFARVGRTQAAQHSERGDLAATVGSEEARDAALGQAHVQRVHHYAVAMAAGQARTLIITACTVAIMMPAAAPPAAHRDAGGARPAGMKSASTMKTRLARFFVRQMMGEVSFAARDESILAGIGAPQPSHCRRAGWLMAPNCDCGRKNCALMLAGASRVSTTALAGNQRLACPGQSFR